MSRYNNTKAIQGGLALALLIIGAGTLVALVAFLMG